MTSHQSSSLNSIAIMFFLLELLERFQSQLSICKFANRSLYVLKSLTDEVRIVFDESFRYKFMTCILDREQKERVDLICKRVCFDQIFQIVMKMLVQILKKMNC